MVMQWVMQNMDTTALLHLQSIMECQCAQQKWNYSRTKKRIILKSDKFDEWRINRTNEFVSKQIKIERLN